MLTNVLDAPTIVSSFEQQVMVEIKMFKSLEPVNAGRKVKLQVHVIHSTVMMDSTVNRKINSYHQNVLFAQLKTTV
jgi:hypothetical protein